MIFLIGWLLVVSILLIFAICKLVDLASWKDAHTRNQITCEIEQGSRITSIREELNALYNHLEIEYVRPHSEPTEGRFRDSVIGDDE